MTPSELFEIWAPSEALWSSWAKPILFAEHWPVLELNPHSLELPDLSHLDLERSAVVIDLPSAESVQAGLSIAKRGFRPVPLFNGSAGPWPPVPGIAAVLDNSSILSSLQCGTETLPHLSLPNNAPPAFLLDSRRRSLDHFTHPGQFDNRWLTFPLE